MYVMNMMVFMGVSRESLSLWTNKLGLAEYNLQQMILALLKRTVIMQYHTYTRKEAQTLYFTLRGKNIKKISISAFY